MRLRHFIYLTAAVLAAASLATAATIHVPADQPTIQAGIDAAVDGDTVMAPTPVMGTVTLTSVVRQ
ncbi:MAG: hypothetical protein ACE5OP_11795 [Candidatus Glassbacteria bacterium]